MQQIASRTRLVYGLLLGVWCVIIGWQIAEHLRVKKSERAALINRSRDSAATVAAVIRSQRRWGVVSQERLESALKEMVKSGELSSVALLNVGGEVVASAGSHAELELKGAFQSGEHWDAKHLTLVNLVDLGATETPEGDVRPMTIIRPPRPPGPSRERMRTNEANLTNSVFNTTNLSDATNVTGLSNFPPVRPPPPEFAEAPPPPLPDFLTNFSEGASSNVIARAPGERPRLRRPPWMPEQEYRSLLQTRGLHGLAITMSTSAFRRVCAKDLWMRVMIGCFAGISAVGLGLAWRNVAKSSELSMRLLRASEMNTHLKEMNLAAAGLAHETRNPLNIIRGLAQMISKQADASPEVRVKSREIVDEADRVTNQLNEFINYSRPREVRRAAVALESVISEVVRALSYDIEEKKIRLQITAEQTVVEADEQLLRQALFNLLLNAIQAVEPNGEIQMIARRQGASEASLDIADNGPGVAEGQRTEIFKPYFTTHAKGTGLGLAVVQQIILVHGWEIHCLANQPKGAIFRITHLKIAEKR